MKNSICNISRGPDLKVSLSLSVISNKSGLWIIDPNNCDGEPVQTSCAVEQ